MREFIYKTIIIIFALGILFELTIGKRIEPLINNLNIFFDKEGRKELANKLRKEMKKSIERENILNKEDRMLINRFLNKLNSELKSVSN